MFFHLDLFGQSLRAAPRLAPSRPWERGDGQDVSALQAFQVRARVAAGPGGSELVAVGAPVPGRMAGSSMTEGRGLGRAACGGQDAQSQEAEKIGEWLEVEASSSRPDRLTELGEAPPSELLLWSKQQGAQGLGGSRVTRN